MSKEVYSDFIHSIPAHPCYAFEMKFNIELVKSFLNQNECIVILKIIEGYRLVEIAKQNNWTTGKVTWHRDNARKKLKQIKKYF